MNNLKESKKVIQIEKPIDTDQSKSIDSSKSININNYNRENNGDKDSLLYYLEEDDGFENDINRMSLYQIKSTGFVDLDSKLNGGLHAGLYVVGGVSSLGKTTFIHQIADNVASQENSVIFFSLEQSKMELVSKSLSRETFKLTKNGNISLTVRNILAGQITETSKKAIATYKKTATNFKLLEGNFNTTVKTIREYIKNHVDKYDDNPLVIVDYLQIIQPIDVRMSDKQKIDTTVTELKRISRDFNIPLIVISSLNRDSYLSPISYESFKESGGIEYTADIILGLQYANIDNINTEKNKIKQRQLLKEESLKNPREIELVCLKQRNGNQIFSCGYDFYPNFNYFNEKV